MNMALNRLRRPLQWAAAMIITLAIARPALADNISQYNQLMPVWLKAMTSGDVDLSLKYAEKMLALAKRALPNDVPLSYSRVGNGLMAKGDYQEAISYYEAAIKGIPNLRPTSERDRFAMRAAYNDSVMGLGTCYYSLADYEKAINYFQLGIKFNREINKDSGQETKGMSLLANTYREMGEREQAHELYRETIPILEQSYARADAAGAALAGYMLGTSLQNWALMYIEEGRYDRAEPMLRRAVKLVANYVGWESAETASVASALGNALLQQGRGDQAEQYLNYAWETEKARIGEDHPHTLITLAKLATLYRDMGRQEEAVEMMRQVVAGHEKRLGPDHPQVAMSISSLGTALIVMDRAEEAEPIVQRAVEIAERKFGPENIVTAQIKFTLGNAKIGSLKANEAFPIAEELIALNERRPLRASLLSGAYSWRAMKFYMVDKDPQRGIEALSKGIELHEAERWQTGGAERERAQAFEEALGFYGQMVEWQAEQGNLPAVFATMEQVKARTFLEELELKGMDLMEGRPTEERERLLRRETELRKALTTAEQRYAALPSPGPNPAPEVVAKLREAAGDVHRAQQALYEHLAAVRKSSSAYQQLMSKGQDAASLGQVQKSLLGPEDLLLLYHFGRGTQKARVFAVRKQDAVLHDLVVTDDVAKALGMPAGPLQEDALTDLLVGKEDSILAALSSPTLATTKNAQLAALWKLLIPENLRSELTSGQVKRLVIVPAGPLTLLPFEAIVVDRAEESNPTYLLDAGPPITYAPSATVLLNLASRKPQAIPAGREPVLTVGDPAYPQVAQADARGAALGSSQDQFRAGLSRLPYSAWEATWIEQNFAKHGFAAAKLTGSEATEAGVRRLAPGRSTVHLACHGMVDQGYGNFFGALAFAPGKPGDPSDDGFLSMSEIYDLDLSACELAILSACQTNYGPRQKGEGVWALSRGFLVAGSRRVVASNWVVDDQAAASLISYFGSLVAKSGSGSESTDDESTDDESADKESVKPADYATSLQTAKKWVRDQEKWSSPYYWATFVLVGPQ